MEIIDSEGKFFGKINILDLVLLFVIFGFAFFAHTMLIGSEKFVFVTILVDPEPSVLENTFAGDVETSPFTGNVIGEIVGVEVQPAFTHDKNIAIILKLSASEKLGKKFYKESLINVGRKMDFETKKVFLQGQIIGIADSPEKLPKIRYEKVIVKVTVRDVPLFVAQKLEKGELNEFAEITDRVVIYSDKKKGDLILKMKLATAVFSGTRYFDNAPIAAGSQLDFSPIVKASGIIEEIGPDEQATIVFEEKNFVKFITIDIAELNNEVLKNIETGDKEIASDGQTLSEIISIDSFYLSKDARRVFIKAAILASEMHGGTLFKGSPLVRENGIIIEIRDIPLKGKIFYISDSEAGLPVESFKTKKTTIVAKAFFIEPWIAEKITAGRAETDPFTGEKTITITKKTEQQAEVVVTTDSGEVLKKSNPVNKDIELELQINEAIVNSRRFLKDTELIVGNDLKLEFDDVAITTRIINAPGETE